MNVDARLDQLLDLLRDAVAMGEEDLINEIQSDLFKEYNINRKYSYASH